MHSGESSYVQKEINMSEGLVNIDLPWHIPEYTYQQRTWMEVLELLQWWHGRIWLSMTPPVWCRPKRRRAPCQLNWIIKVRSYTQLVCRNHGPRWHDPLAQCFGVGGAKCISFLCIWACAKQGGVAKPRIVRGTFLFLRALGLLATLCKVGSGWELWEGFASAWEQGWVEPGGEMFFC